MLCLAGNPVNGSTMCNAVIKPSLLAVGRGSILNSPCFDVPFSPPGVGVLSVLFGTVGGAWARLWFLEVLPMQLSHAATKYCISVGLENQKQPPSHSLPTAVLSVKSMKVFEILLLYFYVITQFLMLLRNNQLHVTSRAVIQYVQLSPLQT